MTLACLDIIRTAWWLCLLPQPTSGAAGEVVQPGAKMAAALKLQSLCLQAVHGNSAAAVAAALPSAAKAQITDGEKSLD